MEQINCEEFISVFARLLGSLTEEQKASVQAVLTVLDQEQEKAV